MEIAKANPIKAKVEQSVAVRLHDQAFVLAPHLLLHPQSVAQLLVFILEEVTEEARSNVLLHHARVLDEARDLGCLPRDFVRLLASTVQAVLRVEVPILNDPLERVG